MAPEAMAQAAGAAKALGTEVVAARAAAVMAPEALA